MISEITVRPKAKNKYAQVICILFLLLAAAVTVLYATAYVYRGVIGLGAVAMLAAAIYIYTKYIGSEYCYDVSIVSGTPMLLVRQRTGNRSTLLLDIRLSSIREVRRETRAERRAHKPAEGTRRYAFTPTVCPDEVYRIVSSFGGEYYEIVIECESEFADLLMRYAEEARASLDEE